MTQQVTGGCACGRVKYQGGAAEAAPFRCFCRDCQRATGTGHSEMLPLQAESVVWTGTLKEHQLTGGSGKLTWCGFCGDCGSPLTRRSQRMSDRIYVHAGSLDDPGLYAPEKDIYVDAAHLWDAASGG